MAATEFKYIITAQNYSKFDVIGVGAWDAKIGIQKVRQVAAGSATDFICANIKGFVPYLRLNKDSGKIKVLITSIVDPQLLEVFKIKDVEATDPVKAANRIKNSIKHDIFILIVHAQGERRQEIIAGCGDVDLVVDGETGRVENKVLTVSDEPVVCNNYGGKYISYIDLLQAQPSGVKVGTPVFTRVVAKEVALNPEVEALVAKYDAERRDFIKTERERRERKVMKTRKPANLYLGSNWCGSCHKEIVNEWQKTRHAKAIRTLEKKQKASDPKCFVCHVTGAKNQNAVGGFVSNESTPNMVNVQCEVCHGPGGRHAQTPKKVKMTPVSEQGCRSCHNQETDPDFSYQKDLLIINHGKDPRINGK